MPKAQKKELTKKEKAFYEELVAQMLTLVTSGFGVVAALAWNSAIQDFVKEFIEPRVPGSGLAYKFLYAILISSLIVLITFYLSKLLSKFQKRNK